MTLLLSLNYLFYISYKSSNNKLIVKVIKFIIKKKKIERIVFLFISSCIL